MFFPPAGELAKYDMLHEAIVHRCIKQVNEYFHCSFIYDYKNIILALKCASSWSWNIFFFYSGKFLENSLKFHSHLVTNTDEISILQLLDKKKRATMADMSESMECLCYLMKTVGPKLDVPKAKVYFFP